MRHVVGMAQLRHVSPRGQNIVSLRSVTADRGPDFSSNSDLGIGVPIS